MKKTGKGDRGQKAEEALRESKERLRRSFDDAAIGMSQVSPRGEFLRVNPFLCKITGYSKKELLGKTFQDITHPEDLQIGADYLRKMSAGEIDTAHIEKRYIHKDGHILWVFITTTLLRDAEGNPLHFVVQTQDVTERKKVEEELKDVKSGLEERVEERTRELQLLQEINNALNSTMSLDEILKIIVDGVVSFPEYDTSEIFLLNEEESHSILQQYAGTSKGVMRKIEEKTGVKIDGYEVPLVKGGLYHKLYKNQEPLLTSDMVKIFKELTDNPVLKKMAGPLSKIYGMKSMVVTPLVFRGRTIGSFTAGSKKMLTESDAERIKNFAGQAVLAIEKAKLHEETERNAAELSESEEKFRLAFENAKDAIFWADLKMGTITNCNIAAEGLLEKKKEEIIGQHQTVLHPPEKAEHYTKMFKTHIEEKGAVDDEAEVITKSGRIKPVRITASVTLIEGKPLIQGIFRDITIRKEAEEALKSREARFRGAFENAAVGASMVDLKGRFLKANRRLCEMLGYSEEELQSRTFSDVTHPDDIKIGMDNLKRQLAGKADYTSFEKRYLHKDGHVVHVNVSPALIRDEKGEPQYFVGLWQDITERKEAEEEIDKSYKVQSVINSILQISLEPIPLREQLERIIDVVVSIPWLVLQKKGAIFLVEDDTETLVMKAQHGLAELLLKECEKVPFGRCICGRTASTKEITFTDCIDERHDTRYDGMQPHGHYCMPILSGSLLLGVLNLYVKEGHKRDQREEEFLSAVAHTLAGVIERKQVEEALSRREKRYRDVVENVNDGVYVHDENGIYTYVNNKLAEMHGYTPKEMIGKSFLDLVPAEERAERKRRFEKSKKMKIATPAIEAVNLKKDGTFVHVEIRPVPIIEQGELKGYIGVIRDVTERKRAEEMLKQEHQQMLSIFDGINEVVYISDPDSHEILYINQALKEVFGDVVGQKCYQAFQRVKKPCSFCTNEHIFGKNLGKSHIWEFQNKINKRWYRCIDKAIRWPDGRMVRYEMAIDVTESKEAEKALRESEGRYRTIFENVSDLIVYVDKHGKIIEINEQIEDVVGYKREEVIGKNFLKLGFLSLKNLSEIRKMFFDAVKRGGDPIGDEATVNLELEIKHKNGNAVLVETSTINIKKDGKLEGFLSIIRDVTERKRTEALIEESELFLSSVFMSIQDGINVLDKDLNIIRANPMMLYWYPHSIPLVGKKCYEAYHRRSKRCEVCPGHHTLKTGEAAHEVAPLRGADGNIAGWLDLHTFPLVDAETGEVIGVVEYVRDITNRKKSEEALKESEERFRAIATTASDAITVIDNEGKIIHWNPAAEAMFGYTVEEATGQELHIFLAPKKFHAPYKNGFKKFKTTGKGLAIGNTLEFTAVRKDGTEFPIEVSTSALLIKGKWHATGIIRDITERKQAEEQMLRKFLRFNVRKGELYLIKEMGPSLSVDVFRDLLNCGFTGTIFSRAKKKDIEELFGNVEIFWLAEGSRAKHAVKPKFSEIESRISALGTGNNAVLIDRMDYLILKNGFSATLKFVQRLFEQAYQQRLVVILSLDPKTLKPHEVRRLEKETKRVEPKVRSRLPRDLYEILKFVYRENRIGAYPSYKDVHEKFEITRTTARNRIKQLRTMKLLVDRKRGRTKVLEITDEGREQF